MNFLIPFCLLLLPAAISNVSAEPVPLFDGKTFAGWKGDTGTVWRIEDGALTAGSLETRQEKNNFLITTKEYQEFELTLKWRLEGTEGFVNGGVQFRSKPSNSHHVIGYQADLGKGYDGSLYDESRRKKMLARPAKEVLTKARKPLGEWNDYRIRAEGPRIQIWLNGVQTVDFTEPDADIPQSGIIAVQIHGNATCVVQYKDIKLEELHATTTVAEFTGPKPPVVALTGGANIERTRFNGFLQTHLITNDPTNYTKVRNFGREGDTVFEQWRNGEDNVDRRRQRDWQVQLDDVDATRGIADLLAPVLSRGEGQITCSKL